MHSGLRPKPSSVGFTLIEIVIVLAIAGLVMFAVFLGVTGAQQSQRDSDRRAYTREAYSQMLAYAGNNGGRISTITADDIVSYMGTDRKLLDTTIPATTKSDATSNQLGVYLDDITPVNGSSCAALATSGKPLLFQIGTGSTPGTKTFVATCLESKTWYVVNGTTGGVAAPSGSAVPTGSAAPTATAVPNPSGK